MSIILPNLNHSFISPVPVPVPVPDPDFRVFHTPIQLVFSTTRTWIPSFNCVHFQRKTASVIYVPDVHSANHGKQYLIQVISNIIRYFT